MYVDSSDLNSPVAMETEFGLIEDVEGLKQTIKDGATQVNNLTLFSPQGLTCAPVLLPFHNMIKKLNRLS